MNNTAHHHRSKNKSAWQKLLTMDFTLNLPFLEQSSPPPFYQSHLSDQERIILDKWFIGSNSTQYYLQEFAKIDKAGKLSPSFNAAAMVMTFGWLLYRRRFLDCFVYMVAGLSFVKLNIVIVLALLEFMVISHLNSPLQMPLRLGAAFIIWLFWALFVARWSNAYYYRVARREIADALELFPNDKEAQQHHLSQTGRVSIVGLVVGFGIFAGILAIIAISFLPIIAKSWERDILMNAYYEVKIAQKNTQPATCSGNIIHPKYLITRTANINTIKGNSDCAVILTIQNSHFPLQYLNGETVVLYYKMGQWHCQSSLSSRHLPANCQD